MRPIKIIIVFFFHVSFALGQWSDVSLGVNHGVNELYIDSSSGLLFVGGQFDTAGSQQINNIATYDGLSWNSFGNNQKFSSPGYVNAIVNYNGSIVVGGEFDSIGQVAVNNIARWNGIAWETIGNGFDRNVNDLIVYKGELYACGSFFFSGQDTVECFAKWNGTNWVRVTQLLGYGNTFEIFKGKLILGGILHHATISSFYNIMGWDGVDIDTTFGYFNDAVIRLRNYSDTLYATGAFTSNITNPSNYVSLYYNQSWHSIGSPTGGQNWISDAIVYNNELYLSGYFTNPPDLCRYNGIDFDSVANVNGFIWVLVEYKSSLFAAGVFNQLNGMNINFIAKYINQGNDIVEVKKTDEVNIYPNPSINGTFNLEITHDIFRGKINLSVYSIGGDKVFNSELYKNSASHLHFVLIEPSGIYFLRIELNDSIVLYKKLIII